MPLGGKPCPPHQKNDRGTLQRHCSVDPKPHWPEKTIPPPQGGKMRKALARTRGPCRAFLLASFRTCGSGRQSGESRPGDRRQVLVVWEWGETDPFPSLCEVQKVGAGDQEVVAEN